MHSSSPLGVLICLASAIGIALLGSILLRPFRKKIQQWTSHTVTQWDDIAYDLIENTNKWVVAVWLFSILIHAFGLQDDHSTALKVSMVFATTYQVTVWMLRAIRGWRDRKFKTMTGNGASSKAPIKMMSTVIEAMIIIILLMVALSNVGVNISAFITGLGIGGVAVALAAQNILGDLFASFSILFDKPFVIGDSISVGQDNGTVENIGLKTTRVKSITGEQIIFSNKDLLESRIHNFQRMDERRVVQKLRVGFDTPIEKLKLVPQIVQSFFPHEKARIEYCRFSEITDYAYSFETVFWILGPEYNVYLQVVEEFYLSTLSKMQQQGLHLTTPTYKVDLPDKSSTHSKDDGHTLPAW